MSLLLLPAGHRTTKANKDRDSHLKKHTEYIVIARINLITSITTNQNTEKNKQTCDMVNPLFEPFYSAAI